MGHPNGHWTIITPQHSMDSYYPTTLHFQLLPHYTPWTVITPLHYRYLYVNVRRWPENCLPNLIESPAIASEIELRVVDLENLTLLDTVYSGHK